MAKRMVVFGYSITYGNWDVEGGWVYRLRKYLDKKFLDSKSLDEWQIYNLGISAQTVDQLLERLDDEAKRRIRRKGDIIFISIDTNDAIWIKSKKRFKSGPEVFKKAITQIVKKSKKYPSEIIVVGPTPVDEFKTMPLSFSPDEYIENKILDKINNISKSVCKTEGAEFIDLYQEFNKEGYKKLLIDGLHPNTNGHELIYKIVRKFLEEKKFIK